MQSILSKPVKLLLILSTFFVANALIAECIGGKIFSLEKVFGIAPLNLTILGQAGLGFSLTCGVLLWPLEFVMTDIVNEYFGPRVVKRISYIAVGLITYAFIMFYVAMGAPPADFWYGSAIDLGVPDMDKAFNAVFGQGMWIIAGSLVAFLVSQIVDVHVFHAIKKKTGDKKLWLRATGSTIVSQLVDSFIVLFIAFKLGRGWDMRLVLAICLVNYTYKFIMAWVLTPLLYLIHRILESYLGKETDGRLRQEALQHS